MKKIKKYEDFETTNSVDDVIKEYTANYKSDFFREFIERFPDKDSFDDKLFDYYDEDFEDEYLDDYDEEGNYDEEIEHERRWSPEAEVNMLESEVGNYPGDEIWVDFHNDLCDAQW